MNTRIYDINETTNQRTNNEPATDDPRTANERATTNKKEKKEKKYSPHSDEWRLAELLLDRIVERKPDFRRPELDPWAGEISRMIRPAQDVEP